MNIKIEEVKLIISQITGISLEGINGQLIINDSDITSISIIETVAQIEQDLGIELLPEDLDITKYKTLGDFFEAVERAINADDQK